MGYRESEGFIGQLSVMWGVLTVGYSGVFSNAAGVLLAAKRLPAATPAGKYTNQHTRATPGRGRGQWPNKPAFSLTLVWLARRLLSSTY